MRDKVLDLPKVIREVYIEELQRQFEREELMDREEFRRNFVIGLHKRIGEDDFRLYSPAIWDVVGIIELNLLKDINYGDKVFRCINESGVPIYHELVYRRLRDPEYVINTVEDIPNIVDYVLDYVLDNVNLCSDVEIIRILQKCVRDTNIHLSSYYLASPDMELLVDKMTPILDDVPDDEIDVDSIDDKSQLKLFELPDCTYDSKTELEIGINDILESTLLYYMDIMCGNEDMANASMRLEIELSYQLEELIMSEGELMDLIGLGPKFYKIVDKMAGIIETEVMSFLVEIIRGKYKHNSVKIAVANIMKYYLQSRL